MKLGSAAIAIVVSFVGGLFAGHLTAAFYGSASHSATAHEEGVPDAEPVVAEAPAEPAPTPSPEAPAPAPARKPDPDQNKIFELDIPSDAPWRGTKKNPKLVVQLVADFECPSCTRAGPLVDDLLEDRKGEVLVVWRDYPIPFHQHAMLAHEAAREVFEQAGNKKFWKYHDILYDNQRQLTRDNLEKWASELGGIDMAEFKKALDTHEHVPDIEADMQEVEATGAHIGTPSFFVNGRLIRGALPYEGFKNVMRAVLRGS